MYEVKTEFHVTRPVAYKGEARPGDIFNYAIRRQEDGSLAFRTQTVRLANHIMRRLERKEEEWYG